MTDDASELEKLRAELNSLRTVLDEVGTYVFTKDLAGCYTYANRSVLELFGTTLAETVGKDDNHFFDLVSSDELRKNDLLVMEQGQTIAREELTYVKPSGEQRIYWTMKKPVLDKNGRIVGMCGISTDITERKQLERELAKQRQMLETVLNNVDAFVYIRDSDHRFHYVNEKLSTLLGRSETEVIGRTTEELLPDGAICNFTELDNQVFATGTKQAGQEHIIDRDGRVAHYWSIKVPIDVGSETQALIGFSTEITELYALQEELKRLSNTDALTNLPNRRAFLEAAEREFSRAVRHNTPLALLILDIDHFKQINDRFGHPAGDAVLAQVAERIRASLRKEDLPARIGGEEFAVLLPETDLHRAEVLAERIRHSMAEQTFALGNGQQLVVTVSIGLTTVDSHDDAFSPLYSRADGALYDAKQQGRNRVSHA